MFPIRSLFAVVIALIGTVVSASPCLDSIVVTSIYLPEDNQQWRFTGKYDPASEF
jgi:hypothetical protein